MEAMIKNFLKSMSKEDKQKMMQAFMNSMSEEEKAEMMQMMIPIIMKHMKPSMMMSGVMENFGENDCKEMTKEMPPETRDKCERMMISCLKTLQEMKKGEQQ